MVRIHYSQLSSRSREELQSKIASQLVNLDIPRDKRDTTSPLNVVWLICNLPRRCPNHADVDGLVRNLIALKNLPD